MQAALWLGLTWVLACGGAAAEPPSAPPIAGQVEELGSIHWQRDYDAGLALAASKHRPVLLLFTEVPGCSTVKGFGNGALRHPLIVDAAESLFVPVAVYNNVGGADKQVLQSYGEPAWNNPVVRILDSGGNRSGTRHAGDYTTAALAARMAQALREPPAYLTLLADGKEEAAFAARAKTES